MMLPKKVVILGTGAFAELCPMNEFIIAINFAFKIRKPNIIFNYHRQKQNLEGIPFILNKELYKYLELNPDVFLLNIDNFPIDKILQEYKRAFFTSSIDYLLLYCLYNKVEEVDLYGIQLDTPAEEKQLKSFYFWSGFLTAKGVKINLKYSRLALEQDYMYGFHHPLADLT